MRAVRKLPVAELFQQQTKEVVLATGVTIAVFGLFYFVIVYLPTYVSLSCRNAISLHRRRAGVQPRNGPRGSSHTIYRVAPDRAIWRLLGRNLHSASARKNAEIAKAITEAHCKTTGAPADFVSCSFVEIPSGVFECHARHKPDDDQDGACKKVCKANRFERLEPGLLHLRAVQGPQCFLHRAQAFPRPPTSARASSGRESPALRHRQAGAASPGRLARTRLRRGQGRGGGGDPAPGQALRIPLVRLLGDCPTIS